MQKINIKKLTKEKLAEMYAEAKSAYDAAMDDEERRVRKLEEQNKELIALTEKLEANEKALEEVTAKYKSADHSAAILRSRIDEEKALRDQALEAHGEDMKALEKAKNESRELAKQLGERELELAEAKQRHDGALTEAAHLRGELKAAEERAKRKEELLCAALHTIKTEKSIKEDYHKSLKWCMAHPWRNLWRCMKEHFRF